MPKESFYAHCYICLYHIGCLNHKEKLAPVSSESRFVEIYNEKIGLIINVKNMKMQVKIRVTAEMAPVKARQSQYQRWESAYASAPPQF